MTTTAVRMPALFRDDEPVPEHTSPGLGLRIRRPAKSVRQMMIYLQLLGGPFLAAFDAGIGEHVDG